MRPRKETIGALGRSPARASRPSLPPPPPEPAPERGAIRRWIHGALFDNLGLKFLSMVLAVTVFLLVNTDRNGERTARLKVNYTYADDKVLVSERLDEVYVTIKGPSRRLQGIEGQLQPVSLDLRKVATGDIAITPDMIHGVPIGLTVASISPRSVHVSFSKRIEKVIAVEPAIVGLPPHGYIVRDIKVSPATVKVSGAESTLAPLTTLKTEEVALQTNPNGFTEQPKLVLRGGIDVEGSQEVSVQVTYSRALVTQVLTNRAIQIKGDGDPPKWTLTPTEVEVTVTGELLAIEKATITPVVKIAPTDTKAHEVEVTIEGLPATVGRKVSPERVTVTPVRPPAPPAPTPAPPPPPP